MPYPDSPFKTEFDVGALCGLGNAVGESQEIRVQMRWLCETPTVSTYRINALKADCDKVCEIIKSEIPAKTHRSILRSFANRVNMALLTTSWFFDSLLISAVLHFLLYKYVTRKFNYWKRLKVQYIEPIPFFGNVWGLATFQSTIGKFFQHLYESMPDADFFGMFVFDEPGLVIRSPELIRSILVKDFASFSDRTIMSDTEPVMQHLVFMAKSPEWKHNRSKLTPIFTSGKLRGMVPLINEGGEDLKSYIRRKISVRNEPLEVKEVSSRFTTDVISSCFFGINAHSFDNKDADFVVAGKKLFDFRWSTAVQQSSYFFAHNLAKLFRMHAFDRSAVNFLVNAFSGAIKSRTEGNFKRNDLIDIVIQMKNQDFSFDDEKMLAPALQFFIAGFETSSSTMAFALYELALHPEIQTRLRSEIKDCIKKYNEIGYDALKEMKYLDQCVAETLRKYPALPFLDRRCNIDYNIPGTDVVIEKGTPVFIPMFGLHYDPKYFPEPEKFDPERFAGDYQKTLTPYTYFPFGVGPRNCIGERFGLINTKLGLVHILSEFEVLKNKNTVSPLVFEPKALTLLSRNGLPLNFKKAEDVTFHPILKEVLIVKFQRNEHIHLKIYEQQHEIVIDPECAAAVLRGAHIYAPGVMGMTSGTQIGDTVNIYADISGKCKKGLNKRYDDPKKVFLGIGFIKMMRHNLFNNNNMVKGVAIQVLETISGCPSGINELLPVGGAILQNFPSIVCVHVLNPQPGETILDMCASPGHKTTHIAALMQNQGTLIAIDKTENKIRRLKTTCAECDARVHIFAYDSTQIVETQDRTKDVMEGPPFAKLQFDRVLLDAPCSALGKRPQLRNNISEKVLKSYVPLQRKLFDNAVQLVKTNGVLVYSTCTITVAENEGIVAWALKTYDCLRLDEPNQRFAGFGFEIPGLSDTDYRKLQRFGPSADIDSVGFFIARFVKR